MEYDIRKARPRPLLVLLFFFLISYFVNVCNWVFGVQFMGGFIGNVAVKAYLSFAILGLLIFFFLASPLIYWAYRRANELAPKMRRSLVGLAMGICLFTHDLPIMWLECYLLWCHVGWGTYSGISFMLAVSTFALSFFTTWLSYTWAVSRRLQLYYSGDTVSAPPPGFSSSA